MISDTLRPQIESLFDEIGKKVNKAIDESLSREKAAQKITEIVSSYTTSQSKTLLSDLYSNLSKNVLKNYSSVDQQIVFFEADLRGEIFDKYDFSTNIMDYKEIHRIKVSLIASGVTLLAGGTGIGIYTVLKHALISSTKVPVATILVLSIGMFFGTYFATEKINKNNFKKATANYLSCVKKDFTAWFDSIEEYFNKRVKEIMG